MRGGLLRTAAAWLAGGLILLAASGCAGSSRHSTPAGLSSQREELASVARALDEAQTEVSLEAQATRAAWRVVANGLPGSVDAQQQTLIARARRQSAALRLPGAFQESRAVALTGPAAGINGTFHSFAKLSATGWEMILYAIEQGRRGTAATARFARSNVGLYIESVYDGHFGLSQIGKELEAGYAKLGGAGAFGSSLTETEVQRLAALYSEAHFRLHPHDAVKFGS